MTSWQVASFEAEVIENSKKQVDESRSKRDEQKTRFSASTAMKGHRKT